MSRLLVATVALSVVVTAVSCAGQDVVRIGFSDEISDYTPIVREALEKHPDGNLILKFSKGTYPFYPEEASEEYLCISNNDNGLKRIIFNIKEMKNVSVEGDSSAFLFHGAVIPFAVTDCDNVRISGISVDYDLPFTLEGTVVASDASEGTFTLRIDQANKYRILDNRFYFLGYDWESPLGENIVFNPATKSPYYNTALYEHWALHQFDAEEVAPGVVKFGNVWSKELPPVGSVWVDKGKHSKNRYCPAFALSDSRDITVEDVRVYKSGAMALIAQYCDNVTVRRYSTAQREGSPRMITASADATHFADCSGTILLEDCRFESMLDDATNIHGTYMQMERILNANEFLASFGHYQQEGNHFADKGDVLRFVDRASLRPVGTGKILSIRRINENRYLFKTDFSLSDAADPGALAIENITRGASAIIRNCTVRYNRARSLLLSTPGSVLVENCDFASMMAGLRICGDANYWYESGNTSDIVIRGNRFKDLGIGGHSPQAILQIDPIIPKNARTNDFFYHRNILFEDNVVETFDAQVIYALSVENLTIKNNVFKDSGSYSPIFGDLSVIDVQNCSSVSVSGNDFSQWKPDATISVHNCLSVTADDTGLEIIDKPNPYFYEN